MSAARQVMVRYDRISSLFWMVAALVISVESIRLDIGSLSEPGPGLMPLGWGLIIGVFGLSVFALSFRAPAQEKEVLREEGGKLRYVLLILASMAAYALFIDYLGFRIVTLVWMIFVCRLGGLGWRGTVLLAAVTVIACDLLFGYYLGIRFPRGLLGF